MRRKQNKWVVALFVKKTQKQWKKHRKENVETLPTNGNKIPILYCEGVIIVLLYEGAL